MSYETLCIPASDRVSLKVRDLTVVVNDQKLRNSDEEKASGTPILDHVSFDLKQNELLAIMGGSGSGKTTLLNVLSQRMTSKNKNLGFTGTINFYQDEQLIGNRHIKNSYMLQTDAFPPGLTTVEFLRFQADLKLPPSVSSSEKNELIEKLIDILEIEHLRDSIILGFNNLSNFSGGERRRVSLAVQLLNKPSILFLDEPTTGLDTSSSLKLVQTLRNLASAELGVTIVLSIHQPRPEISLNFDNICLLTRGGRLVYYGNVLYSYNYFMKLNVIAENADQSKLVDSIMNLSVKDTSSKENEARTVAKINKLVESWKLELAKLQDVPLVPFKSNARIFETPRKDKITLWREIIVLTRRTFKMTYRDRSGLFTLIFLPLLLAVICGWMFYKPPADLAGIRSYTSSIYVMLEILGFVPLFLEIERLWAYDGIVFFQEYTENYTSIPGFIISRRLGKVLLEDIPISFGFAFISYFMFGLRLSDVPGGDTDWHYFWIYFAVTILVQFICMSSALACFALSSDFSICVIATNVFYQLQNSACGYFVNASTMPVYVRWIKYICYFWYAFGVLTSNQYSGWIGDCPYDTEDKCFEYSGTYQLETLGFPKNWITEPIVILVAWFIGFNIIAAAGFYFRNYGMSMAKTKENKIGEEEEHVASVLSAPHSKEKFDGHDLEIGQDINIHLEHLDLVVESKFKKADAFQILHDISASFDANNVNVIMGPSGSGKTTLLNLISSRLSKTSNFKQSGKVIINNIQEVSFSQLNKVSGYVTQYDNSLIPHLTVRETFYYQALLRLPLEEHSRIPVTINSLIRQIGLIDCADTLIGNEIMKGISGGERRRVSIGIQLLSRPKLLFLDEPTSGLDSSTSVSILKLLDELAKENGTTVITTIHQPNEEIFAKFGSLLLLARGGFVVYNGLSSAIQPYLEGVGFHKPVDINIADYILDIISQGIDEDRETAQLRINRLIQEWKINGRMQVASGLPVNLKDFKKVRLPFWIRFQTIFRRQVLSSLRSRDAFATRTLQVVALAIIHALFFAPLKNTSDGIDNRLGLIQEVTNIFYVGFINNIAIYPIERDLFYQEFRDGIYNNFEFHSAYFILECLVEIPTSLFFSAFIVFVIGLPRTAGMFFGMFLTCFVASNTGESLGIMVNSVFNQLGIAINILSSLMIVAIFMAGTMSLHMPKFFKAWNYLNPMKYAVGISAELALRGQQFDCPASACELDSGDAVLKYYHLSSYLPGFFGALVACFVIYRVLAVLCCEGRIRYFL